VYFVRFPYPYRSNAPTLEATIQDSLDDIDRLFRHVVPPHDVAGILLELVQGEGGYVIAPTAWLKALREICDRHGILLIVDEVQSGFGRTGDWFASQTLRVEPDIVCMAKGIASGFPLGSTAARKELMSKWGPASHGTTYGGNPVCTAAALATLDVIRDEGLLDNARAQGEYLMRGLAKLKSESPIIGDVRGVGLMTAVEFVVAGSKEPNGEAASRILKRALEAGMILYPCGHWSQTIRLIPPLIITREQVDQGLDIFSKAVLAEG
jgi:4-aminobutyrate aminotransferase